MPSGHGRIPVPDIGAYLAGEAGYPLRGARADEPEGHLLELLP